jgi:hypothetical protein
MSFDILIQMELTFHKIKILIYQSIIPSKTQQCGSQVNNNAFFVAFVGLAYQCKDILFRFIIEYNSLIIIKEKNSRLQDLGCLLPGQGESRRPCAFDFGTFEKKKPKACKPPMLLVFSRRKLGVQGPQLLKERKKTNS